MAANDLDGKARSLKDTSTYLLDMHTKCLKSAKQMAVLGEETLRFAQSLTDYANYLQNSNDPGDISLKQTLLIVADFFRYQETMRAELNNRLAEYFSGPINNFCNMEIKESLDAKRKAENSWTSFETSSNKVKKLQRQNTTGKVLEEQRNQQALKEDYERNHALAKTKLDITIQQNRIYLPEKLVEFLEFQRDFMWQNYTHLDEQSEKLTQLAWSTSQMKEDLRKVHPDGCGCSLQGSSVSYTGAKAASRPAKRLINYEKLKEMRDKGLTEYIQSVQQNPISASQLNSLSEPAPVIQALQQLQQQVSQINLNSLQVDTPVVPVNLPICAACNQPIKEQGLSAFDKQFHPLCFVCTGCKRPFGNAPFFIHQNHAYCETDYAKLVGAQQGQMICAGCNQPITGPYVKAMNKFWHQGHFVCTGCKGSLQGGFWDYGGKPYCPNCVKQPAQP